MEFHRNSVRAGIPGGVRDWESNTKLRNIKLDGGFG